MSLLKQALTGPAANLNVTVAATGQLDQVSQTGGPGGVSSPSASTVVPIACGLSISEWRIQTGETIYLNTLDPGTVGPTAWVAMVARYVFPDGNAVLTTDPNVVTYTGLYSVGSNLRRKSELYDSTYPGP